MPIKITITKTLEDWWGADDLAADCGDDKERFEAALIEMVLEDRVALLDGATWEVEVSK